MNAHDHLEQQLRASVANDAARRPARRLRRGTWSRGVSALIVVVGTVVVAAVAVFALVSLHARQPGFSTPVGPTTTHRSGFGRPPRDPGPIPRNVDDAAVAASWNTAWREDPTCNPGSRRGAGSGVSYGTPSAAMLSTLPALRGTATSADRLPARFYFNGAFHGGAVYVHYIRRVRVVDGITFYLVPAAKLGHPPLSRAAAERCYQLTVAALQARLPSVPSAQRAATRRYGDAEFAVGRYNLETSSVSEGVFLLTERVNGTGVDGGQSPSTIRETGMLGGGGGGTPPSEIVMDGIVPAGVATVTLHFPASRYKGHRLPPLNATGNVVNDVFVIPIPTLFQRGAWPAIAVWRSASGHFIKTINERPLHP